MTNMVSRLCERLLAWAVSLVWRKYGAKLLSGSITIGGHKVPLSDLAILAGILIPILINDLQAGKSAEEIVADLEKQAGPAALAAGEAIANIIYPGAGVAIEIVALLIQHRTTHWTQADENHWMNRLGASSESGV